MKIELQRVRTINPAFFNGSNYSTFSDDNAGGPPVELSYDTESKLVSCRNRLTGEFAFIPSDNVSIMKPMDQGQADSVAPAARPSRVVDTATKEVMDNRLEQSRQAAQALKAKRGRQPRVSA